jgi:spermidine synthase
MHQVIWAKLLVGIIGATAYAQATVLAVFMGGLAIGAVTIGRRIDRQGRPLRTYVILEFAIAAYCLVLPLLVMAAGTGYVALATQVFESGALKLLLRLVLAALVVLVPAILMGGTLPALARHAIGGLEDTQRQVGRLYSLNSFGAVLGAGVAGFLTLPALGVYGSLVVACAMNVVAGLVLWRPAKLETYAIERSSAEAAPFGPTDADAYSQTQYVIALLALALSGFAAMAYEVLVTRIIALSFGASTYSFSVMLMSFITGIAIGGAIAARRRVRNPLWFFGASQIAVVVALLLATPLIERLPYLIALLRIALHDSPTGFFWFQFGKAALCLAVLLVPTTCLGLGFPLVAQIQVRRADRLAGSIGSTYAWNTVGNVFGSIGTSLLLLPMLGLRGAFHLSLAFNLVAGLALLVVSPGVPAVLRFAPAAIALAAGGAYLTAGTDWVDPINMAPNHLSLRTGPENPDQQSRHPATSYRAWYDQYVLTNRPDTILYLDEDSHTTVVVAGNSTVRVLYVNGKPDASTNKEDLETQLLIAHAPLILAPSARSALIIGHGSGITLGSALRHPLERVDVAEISSSVLGADGLFAKDNYNALDDPRVRVYREDGQTFLRTTPRRYDVIISEPSNPWMAGVSALFTVEFFEAARDRLEPGGVFCMWFHTYHQNDEGVQLVLRTLDAAFPHAVVFADNDEGNLIILASEQRLQPDYARMERRFERAEVRSDLARLGMVNFTDFLTHHRFSEDAFRGLLGSGPRNTESRQRLEYAAPRSYFLGENSFFVERRDPLLLNKPPPTGLMIDEYRDWRRVAGRPVGDHELDQAALYSEQQGGYGSYVARAMRSRMTAEATATD